MRPYHFRARSFSNTTRQFFKQCGVNLAVEGGMGANGNDNTKLEEDICIHIFTVSAAMVGVCLTVIGVIRVVITLGKADTLADDLLASDALLFLTSCLLSYAALRARSCRRHRIERAADVVFITAIVVYDPYLRVHYLCDVNFS